MESTRSGSICRRFLNGSCRFGSRCYYRHEWSIMQPSQICRYFQKGECWYGERCRYLHILQPDAGTSVSGRRGSVPAVYSSSSSVAHSPSDRRGSEPALLRTIVNTGRDCGGSESTLDASNFWRDTGHLPDNDDAQERSQGTDSESGQNSGIARASAFQRIEEGSSESEPQEGGAAAAAAAASSNTREEETEAFLQSKNVICGICMEKVFEKENIKDHVFGLLPNCNHSFCLKCIATWRKTKDLGSDVVRACPQCRVKSAFYVPSKYWVEGPAKESAVAAFKKKFSKRRCCIYDRYGYCPIKRECLYRHVRNSSRVAFSYFSDDDEDENGVDLLGLLLAVTLLGGDSSEDED
ncbi:makorin, ring finger protein, 4 isoform X2 [Kryptolebias marmoratus]|uniref:RING-type E3 ubiquitin transferase n=1 Tax=Kryptolebias marmoratus TaxID=37003 RepID=A0A3Q3A0U9_KRYMA|nr:makorin, ring finger protein, 4 isoform X2 [Kryptolebias marmoratus]